MSNANHKENGSKRGVPVWVVALMVPLLIGAFFLGTQQVQTVKYVETEKEPEMSPMGPVAPQAEQTAETTAEEDTEAEAKPQPRRSELPEEMVREALMPQQKTVSIKFATLPKVKKLDYYTVQQEKEQLAQAEKAALENQPSENELRARADQERFSKIQSNQTKAPEGYFDAVRAGDLQKLQSMLENGANVNAADTTGSTALMIAAFRKDAKTVEFLLKNGADRTLKNRFQQTAADMAKDAPEVLKLLNAQGK